MYAHTYTHIHAHTRTHLLADVHGRPFAPTVDLNFLEPTDQFPFLNRET